MAGGGLGRWPAVAVVVVASFAVAFPMICAATSHTVGGSIGWTIPPNSSFYPNWSAAQKFAVGDTIVFNFPTGAHTVVEVPKSSYESCSTSNQVGPTLSTGPATVRITSAGTHYYICSVSGHCNPGNQKLSITVSGSSSTTPSTPPVPSNSPGEASNPTPQPTAGGPSGSSSTNSGSLTRPASMVGIVAAAAAGVFLAVALW